MPQSAETTAVDLLSLMRVANGGQPVTGSQSIDATMEQLLGEMRTFVAGGGGSGGGGGLTETDWLPITNAQFKGLRAAPVQVLASPGPGKIRIVDQWALFIHNSDVSSPYTPPSRPFSQVQPVLALVYDAADAFQMAAQVVDVLSLPDTTVQGGYYWQSRDLAPLNFSFAGTANSSNPDGPAFYTGDGFPALYFGANGMVNKDLSLWLNAGSEFGGPGDSAAVIRIKLWHRDVDAAEG